MKKLISTLIISCLWCICLAQKSLISCEDIKFLLHNNLQQADTFLMAKGYTLKLKNAKTGNREYTMAIKGGTHINIAMRSDGKKIFMELETTAMEQYDLIKNSVSQFIYKESMVSDMQVLEIKGICNIYITATDSRPYDPLKQDYIMQIIPDKSVTAFD